MLFRGCDVEFTEETRLRLLDNDVPYLYIMQDDKRKYHRYIEKNLGTIVRDPNIASDKKAGALYSSVQNLLEEVMDDPRSAEVMKRSKDAVENSVFLLMNEPNALECLLKVASYDYYTYTHSVNVFMFSVSLAQRLGFSDAAELNSFGEGMLLHDVGKSLIDASIVNCRGKLSLEQWKIMKLHPVYSHEILIASGGMSEAALDVARHHHEKINGSGYPDSISGDEVSIYARIGTIADIFDALTTQRSYKNAMGSFPALKLMQEEMKEEVDPDLFNTFVNMMASPAKK